MDSRKRVYLFLPFFIAFAIFAGGISYADVDVPDVKRPVPVRKPVSKPYGEVQGQSLSDVLKRIEALESRSGGGNVNAPKVRGLRIGGHIRTRFEANSNFIANTTTALPTRGADGNFTLAVTAPLGVGGSSNNKSVGVKRHENYVVQRVRLAFDFDVNKNVLVHAMIDSNRTFGGDQNTIQGNTADTVSMKQAYFKFRNLGDISPILNNVTLMVGRKQWAYGDQRLIGHLNWTNVGRAHDGAVARWQIGGGKSWIDAVISQVGVDGTDDAGAGQTITQANREEFIYGFYTHFQNPFGVKGILAEPYWLVRDRERSVVDGVAGETRHYTGLRLVGKNIPGLPGVDFTVEPVWQWGEDKAAASRATNDINAFGMGAKAGYTFKNVSWQPRIGYEFVFASGDDKPGTAGANSSSTKTFSQLYPLGHAHLGYMDVHGWQNMVAHAVRLSAKPSKKLLLKADLWFFEADEEADAMYSVAGTVARFGGDKANSQEGGVSRIINVDDEYGQELDLVAKYKLFKNVGVVGGYSHYFTGDFLEDTGHGHAPGMDWFWLQAAVKF